MHFTFVCSKSAMLFFLLEYYLNFIQGMLQIDILAIHCVMVERINVTLQNCCVMVALTKHNLTVELLSLQNNNIVLVSRPLQNVKNKRIFNRLKEFVLNGF